MAFPIVAGQVIRQARGRPCSCRYGATVSSRVNQPPCDCGKGVALRTRLPSGKALDPRALHQTIRLSVKRPPASPAITLSQRSRTDGHCPARSCRRWSLPGRRSIPPADDGILAAGPTSSKWNIICKLCCWPSHRAGLFGGHRLATICAQAADTAPIARLRCCPRRRANTRYACRLFRSWMCSRAASQSGETLAPTSVRFPDFAGVLGPSPSAGLQAGHLFICAGLAADGAPALIIAALTCPAAHPVLNNE